MQTVNIYIYTTIRGPQKQDGAYIYVLETMTSKGPATCSKAGTMNKVTKNQACLFALSAAIKRIFRQCELIIHVDSVFVASCAEKWLADWRKNDWKNAKGQQVANAEAWKEIALLLDEHTYQFIVDKRNSYSDWMKTESDRAKERSVKNAVSKKINENNGACKGMRI